MHRPLFAAIVLCLVPAVLCAAGDESAAPRKQPPRAVTALQQLALKPGPDAGTYSWSTGAYSYDAAGNIIAVGNEYYTYDVRGRLTAAHVVAGTSVADQSFTYDDYGNMTARVTNGVTSSLAVAAQSNHLTGSAAYDANGNVVTDPSGVYHYTWDGLNNLAEERAYTNPTTYFVYTADDERLRTTDNATGVSHYTIRGLDAKVLADFQSSAGTWSITRQYVYRDGNLLAAITPSTVENYSLDHLGTPRLITDADGNKIGFHTYYPFGEELTIPTAQEGNPLRFTGHERDADPAAGNLGLDYMHARYYGSGWGRFLSVDPVLGRLSKPQSWNRYSYANASPVNWVDLTGRAVQLSFVIDGPNVWDMTGGGGEVGPPDEVPAPTTPDGKLQPPPVDLPQGKNGEPNEWVYVPNVNPAPGQRPGRWKPRHAVPSATGAQPSASWDPEGHFDVDIPTPSGGRGQPIRVLPDGTRLGPDHKPLLSKLLSPQNTARLPLLVVPYLVEKYLEATGRLRYANAPCGCDD